MRTRLLALPIAALALTLLAGCSTTTTADPAATSPHGTVESSAPTESAADGTCSYPEQPGGVRDVTAPPAEPTVSGDVTATMSTSAGDIGMTLTADRTPCTVGNFVSLASQQYFDGTECHRLTTSGIFVLQCGDPSATGMGGPGYSIPDEVDGSETYPAGTIAMAKTSAPDSGGSQFFLVYEDSMLPPDYTVFGTMDPAGLAVVQAIAAKGVDPAGPNASQGDGTPLEKVTINTVTVG